MPTTRILTGDCRERLAELPERSIQCVATSPPYLGQRRYGDGPEIGTEPSIPEYVGNLVAVFREVWRVLKDDGVLWLNLDDAYANDAKWGGATGGKHSAGLHGNNGEGYRQKRRIGLPPKSLMGLPWRVALALQDDGWTLRCDVIWEKPNTFPEGSVRDRPTRNHEYLFLFSKGPQYAYDMDAIREPHETWAHTSKYAKVYDLAIVGNGQPGNQDNAGIHSRPGNPAGKNRRSVWKISTVPGPGFHFATFPPGLVEPCILAGSRPGDTVLDPFAGSGTTLREAVRLGRDAIGIELYEDIAERARQMGAQPPLFANVAD